MAMLSNLMISHPEVQSFEDLERLVIEVAKSGEIFLEMDLKPDYPDTPRTWNTRLESAFYRAEHIDRMNQ